MSVRTLPQPRGGGTPPKALYLRMREEAQQGGTLAHHAFSRGQVIDRAPLAARLKPHACRLGLRGRMTLAAGVVGAIGFLSPVKAWPMGWPTSPGA